MENKINQFLSKIKSILEGDSIFDEAGMNENDRPSHDEQSKLWIKDNRTELDIINDGYVFEFIALGPNYDRAFDMYLDMGRKQEEEERIKFSDLKCVSETEVNFEESKYYKPESLEMNYAICKFLVEKKRYKDMLNYAERGIKASIKEKNNYRLCDFYYWHGLTKESILAYSEAIENYRLASKLAPEYILEKIYVHIGNCYIKLKRYDEALKIFEKCSELANSKIKYEDKINFLKKEITKKETKSDSLEDDENHLNKGKKAFETGNYEEALEIYKKAYSTDFDNLEIVSLIAQTIGAIKLKGRRFPNFRAMFIDHEEYFRKGILLSEAKKDDSFLPLYYELLGDFYFYVNRDYINAEKNYEKALNVNISRQNSNRDLFIKIGKCHENDNKCDDRGNEISIRFYLKALRMPESGIECMYDTTLKEYVAEYVKNNKKCDYKTIFNSYIKKYEYDYGEAEKFNSILESIPFGTSLRDYSIKLADALDKYSNYVEMKDPMISDKHLSNCDRLAYVYEALGQYEKAYKLLLYMEEKSPYFCGYHNTCNRALKLMKIIEREKFVKSQILILYSNPDIFK